MFIYCCYRISQWMKIFIIARQCAGFNRLGENPVAVPGRLTARMCPQQASHDRQARRRPPPYWLVDTMATGNDFIIRHRAIDATTSRQHCSRPWRAYRKQFSRYWLAYAAQNTNNQIDYSPYKILANRAVPIAVGLVFHCIVFFQQQLDEIIK